MYGVNVRGLSTVAVSVLVVWGRQDHIIPVSHVNAAAKGLHHARVRIFDDCGHLPMLEHTEAFNKAVLDFLDQ